MEGSTIERNKERKGVGMKYPSKERLEEVEEGRKYHRKKERKFEGMNCPTLLCLMISFVFHMSMNQPNHLT